MRGQALQPLHEAAVEASRESPALAGLLSILDSLRTGDARVRKVAAEALHEPLQRTPTQIGSWASSRATDVVDVISAIATSVGDRLNPLD